MKFRTCFCFALISLSLQLGATVAASQTAAAPPQTAATLAATGTLRGQVTDPSGAAIANANVVMTPAAISSTPITTQANGQGFYEFKGLATGQYTL
ncbi:MAG: carboxypeptidase-like regulatory domain-containing protein, partial [Candidatus Sulfotelmatobacter sp.]